MCNSEKHPEAWKFFVKQARNIENEPAINHLGKYRIPTPNRSGNFLYANDPADLWKIFIVEWCKVDMNSESLYGKIQYIVTKFNH
jgi:hypothetical protein